jgi:hypothetical protein
MKNLLLSLICCVLLSGAAYAQNTNGKSAMFSEIKELRLRYTDIRYYLNSQRGLTDRGQHAESKKWMVETKAKIDSLDKVYTRLLTPAELKQYTEWRNKADVKDKMQDLGWWYAVNLRQGC